MKQRILCTVLLVLGLAGTLAAQTKISGTLSCGKPDPAYKIDVADRPGHSIMLAQFACTWTKPMEIEGLQTKDGVDVGTDDGSGTKLHGNGYHYSNMSNGDKIFVHFSGTDTMTKYGKPVGNAGTWSFTGGTGKLKGITGKGSYKGSATAEGSMVTDVEGEYQLPAAK